VILTFGQISLAPSLAIGQQTDYKCDGKFVGQKISAVQMDKVLDLHQQWFGAAGWMHEFNTFLLPTDEQRLPNEPATAPKLLQFQNDPQSITLWSKSVGMESRDHVELQGADLEGASRCAVPATSGGRVCGCRRENCWTEGC
jgi:hypothetical protein